jgi:hypothetical protein
MQRLMLTDNNSQAYHGPSRCSFVQRSQAATSSAPSYASDLRGVVVRDLAASDNGCLQCLLFD